MPTALTIAPAALHASPPHESPATVLWYTHPAEKWENALPIGNGRLGAMVFGRTDEEIIQLNEDTYWSGGPYSTTVKGGYQALPEIRRLLFEGANGTLLNSCAPNQRTSAVLSPGVTSPESQSSSTR